MRLTKRIRDGLNELCAIGDTVIQHGGEGWALACTDGPDRGPCNRPLCETCCAVKNLSDAIAWLDQFLARKKQAAK